MDHIHPKKFIDFRIFVINIQLKSHIQVMDQSTFDDRRKYLRWKREIRGTDKADIDSLKNQIENIMRKMDENHYDFEKICLSK